MNALNEVGPAKRVAIYCRVSSEGQIDNTSLDEQVKKGHAFAAVKGWDVVSVYQDEGISGTEDEDGRPALDEMFTELARRKFSIIIMKDESRLARDTNISGYITHKIKKMGGELVFTDVEYDTNTLQGVILQAVDRMYAQMERMMIVKRTTAGRNARDRIDGEKGGRVPMGYKRLFEGGRATGELVIDPLEAIVVRRIKGRRDTGQTLTQIANDLNDDGITTRRGRPWHASSVREILKNVDKYRGGPRGESSQCWPVLLN